MTLYGLAKYTFAGYAALGAAVITLRMLAGGRTGKLVLLFAAGLALGAAAWVDANWLEPNWIQVRRVVVRDAELARVAEGLRILQITDIHMTQGLSGREKQLIAKVNALKPDLLFFTGDLIDDLSQLPHALELFRRFKVRLGIFAIPGDTDQGVMDSYTWARELSEAPVNVLLNEARGVKLPGGKVLWIAGYDPRSLPRGGSLSEVLAAIPEGAPKILLAHSPDHIAEAAREGVELVLAGDTHGGQVGIDFLVRLSRYANRTPYMRGLFTKGRTKMYVNRGIGTKTLNIRFLCRPEIAVIEVKK